MNPYKILEITEGATKDEIKRAYKKMALKFHPDVYKGVDANTKMVEINKAFDMLMKGIYVAPQKPQQAYTSTTFTTTQEVADFFNQAMNKMNQQMDQAAQQMSNYRYTANVKWYTNKK